MDALFKAITTPPPRYYVRVNTFRIFVNELVRRLNARGVPAYRDEHIEEAIWLPVQGPSRMPAARKMVVVDKKALLKSAV